MGGVKSTYQIHCNRRNNNKNKQMKGQVENYAK